MKINISIDINKEDLITLTETFLKVKKEQRQERNDKIKKTILDLLDTEKIKFR